MRKARWRAVLIAFPLVLLTWLGIGILFSGHPLGKFAGIFAAVIGYGVFSALSPGKEVLKPDDKNPIKLSH